MHTLPRIFIDTNVWFSLFYGSENAEHLIRKHISGKIKAVISKDVLDELVKNIVQKIPKLEKTLLNFLEAFPPEIVDSPDKIDSHVKSCVHHKDRHIFQACINSKCDIFVTGNLKDFNKNVIEKEYDIKILSIVKALKYLTR